MPKILIASTLLNESQLFSTDAIERQMDHDRKGGVRGIYNHAQYKDERFKIMHWYGDKLEGLGLKL